jgi:hypothetical protein
MLLLVAPALGRNSTSLNSSLDGSNSNTDYQACQQGRTQSSASGIVERRRQDKREPGHP